MTSVVLCLLHALGVSQLTPVAQASATQGLLLRKSCDGHGAVFAGLLADKHCPDARFKFNMFFGKTGTGSASQLSSSCPTKPGMTQMASSISFETLSQGHQRPATLHDEPFDGPYGAGISMTDDILPEVQVQVLDESHDYILPRLHVWDESLRV